MFLCHGLLCDRTAAVWMRGKAWCVPCSIKRFGFGTGTGGSPTRGGSEPDPVVALSGREAAPASEMTPGRTPATTSALETAEAVAPEAAPRSGVGFKDIPSFGPVPDHLSTDEMLGILERDGWNDVEFDLFARSGRTLHDLERTLAASLQEGTE